MAISYTVSYTFSPSTTISSSQVNTNFSDNSNTWNGLEALTKSFAKLKVDVDPTTALEVATKQYVDHYSAYRRPVLQYASATVVNMETGITGTSGQAQILFPDGNLRQDSTTGRINCNLAQVAALSGAWQSGLRTGSVAVNTWYAVYAVKTTDDSSKFVAVADTVLPLQANFTTLNSNFGSSGWVYLGMVKNGDSSGSTNVILSFKQAGNITMFSNVLSGAGTSGNGPLLGSLGSSTSLTYTYTSGTGSAQIPAHLTLVHYGFGIGGGTVSSNVRDAVTNALLFRIGGGSNITGRVFTYASGGLLLENSSNVALDVFLCGFVDGVLGVGSNPIL